MVTRIDNVLIQVREKLRQRNIKLWLEPYYFDEIGTVESEMEKLATEFSKELGIPLDTCRLSLNELQDGALAKLEARKQFDETGIATLTIRVIQMVNGTRSSSVSTMKCNLTETGRELQSKLGTKFEVDPKRIKIISSGRVISEDVVLMAQGINNNHQLLAMISSNENSNIDNIYDRVQEAKKDVESILKSRSNLMTMEDQDGNAIHLPPNESNALMFALAMYEKGRAALKREKYEEALVIFLEADENFSTCNSKLLDSVDNYALLNLDIVWCYLCLKSFSHLPDAERRLQICENNFRRTYGDNFNRVLSLKNSAQNERCLLMRLHLLQGVLLFHQNQRNQAHEKLSLAESELRSLNVDEIILLQLSEMGYTTSEARIALRSTNNDIEQAINFITERKRKKEEARKLNEEEFKMNLGSTQNDENWVNPRSLSTLVEAGFERELARTALKKAENDVPKAIDLLHNNREELLKDISKVKANDGLVNEFLKLGFNSEMVTMALENSFNNQDQALDLLLKWQNGENFTAFLNSLTQFSTNDNASTSDGAGPSTSSNPAEKFMSNIAKTVSKEMEAKNAYNRFTKDVSIEDDEYLDLPLVQEETILLEYKFLLEN